MTIPTSVWIGYDILVMPGVKIGNGTIIAACSVIASNVPAYTVVGGNPAMEIRRRFSPDVVAELEAIPWWEWSIEQITKHRDAMFSTDIVALRACHRN
ncbi:MAG: hypothetical protein EA399_08080 [Desulfovibrionales bacterium]|nr:MAG: hypothetical protein EA399_08080 [Desulfovibrionales bacterium]